MYNTQVIMENFSCLLNRHITASHSCIILTQACDITFAVCYNSPSYWIDKYLLHVYSVETLLMMDSGPVWNM